MFNWSKKWSWQRLRSSVGHFLDFQKTKRIIINSFLKNEFNNQFYNWLIYKNEIKINDSKFDFEVIFVDLNNS